MYLFHFKKLKSNRFKEKRKNYMENNSEFQVQYSLNKPPPLQKQFYVPDI